ncbi:MAG: hypothetical protein QNI87_09790 [Erythrobacter sp.]|uniref:hypothetical protein n=1 Tax=Erythrobacter sp. TaxID=1042 RepID=UPI0026207B75|nr:hypothetical protein [Erythrobacter sp.]MDJ0978818.1 hypothetical protein [Erythrobacter sp.]
MFEIELLETKSAESDKAANATPARPARYRPRRSTADRLRAALLALAESHGEVVTHEESAWSSITFTGTRHEVVLDFDGCDAVEAGETFIAELPEHEFRIPGQLVADASVREVDHRFGADERMVVTCVLLLLEEV